MKRILLFGAPLSKEGYDSALLLLRLFVGAAMLTHGIPKLMNFAALSQSFPDPIGLGSVFALSLTILAEVACSVFLILGLFTRLSALPMVINMAVAAFIIHAGGPFSGKELAVFYFAVYLFFLLTGAGRYSFDYKLFGGKS